MLYEVITHYEYVARYVDDVIAFGKDPMKLMKELKDTYVMKGVGKPRYYLGGDVLELDEQWQRENISHSFSAQMYIQNCAHKLTRMLGLEKFAKRSTPMSYNFV